MDNTSKSQDIYEKIAEQWNRMIKQQYKETRDRYTDWMLNTEIDFSRVEPVTAQQCQHEYKLYTGLVEQFEYCIKCDHKKD